MVGEFSPIDEVVREAEEFAVKQWKREHEPCKHPVVDFVLSERDGRCGECGARLPREDYW